MEKGNLRFSAGGEWTPRIEVLGDEGSGEGQLPGSGNILKLKKNLSIHLSPHARECVYVCGGQRQLMQDDFPLTMWVPWI